jgi:hypothetical protein
MAKYSLGSSTTDKVLGTLTARGLILRETDYRLNKPTELKILRTLLIEATSILTEEVAAPNREILISRSKTLHQKMESWL